MKRLAALLAVAGALAFSRPASAVINVAVFGDNAIDDLINSMPGYSATLVSNGDLATAGFLSGYSAVFVTRDGDSFGGGLSAAAAANVKSYVKCAIGLVGDFADPVAQGNANVSQLVMNAVALAAAGGGGYIGEFNGSAMAFDANSNGFNALGFFRGTAGSLTNGPADGNFDATAGNSGHAIFAGVTLPDDPFDLEFGHSVSGEDASQVLATYANTGDPAIMFAKLGGGGGGGVPEPGTMALFVGAGVAGLAIARKRRA